MPRNTGRKKPEAVGRVVDEKTQQFIDVFLDRNILDFYFEFQGEEHRDPDATVLKNKASEMLKQARELKWIPVIRIDIDHPTVQKAPSKEEYGHIGMVKFKATRFYLTVTQMKTLKRVDWDAEKNWDEWINHPMHRRSAIPGFREAEDTTPKETLEAYRIRVSDNFKEPEGMLIKGELILPFYQRREKMYHHSEEPQPIIYLPYTEAMWEGLMQMLGAVRAIADKLDDLVKTPNNLDMLSRLGSGMVTLALPEPSVDEVIEGEMVEELDDEALADLVSLVEPDRPPVEWIARLSADQRTELKEWAAAVHVHASDNDDVEVPPRPSFLPTLA